MAHFPNTFCNITSHFSEENIIINLSLCKPSFLFYSVLLSICDQFEGGWAGLVTEYQDSGCPSTCVGMFCFVNLF